MKNSYFGQEQSLIWSDTIQKKYDDQVISKRVDEAELPGGLLYEAEQLGINEETLLRALEGMRYEGKVKEINDGHYAIVGSNPLTRRS